MRTRVFTIITAVFLAVTGASMAGSDPGILPSDGYPTQTTSLEGQSAKDSQRAGGPAQQRPIEDWVDTQGTFCLDFETFCESADECDLSVPPIENFIAWTDPLAGVCASVDYAGLADKWITEESGGDVSFGTEFSGSITERPLEDGRAEVRVILRTTNALSLAITEGCDFGGGDLLFGHRAPEVLDGAEAALGQSVLELVFINTAPGADLPDLIQLAFCPEEDPDQELLFIGFRATSHGPLREAFGVEDGTPGRMQTTQTGVFMSGFHGAVGDGFPAEYVRLRVVGR